MTDKMHGVYYRSSVFAPFTFYVGFEVLGMATKEAAAYSDRHPAREVVILPYPAGYPDNHWGGPRYRYCRDESALRVNSGLPAEKQIPSSVGGSLAGLDDCLRG